MKALDNITINQKYGLVLKEDIEKTNCVISKQKQQIERLQEQLKEANEVIKYIKQKTESNYDNKEKVDVISTKALCYLAMWGVR